MTFDPAVDLGSLVTAVSVLIASASLAWTWVKDRRLREREYADRVRRAAITALVGLERWRELALALYDDIQPLLTEADVMLVETQDVVKTRDSFWRSLLVARREASRQFTLENLEATYQDLYVHDPSIHAQFADALQRLKSHDRDALGQLQQTTQRIILDMNARRPFASTDLGNLLRAGVRTVAESLATRASECVLPFRDMVLTLVTLQDREILQRSRHTR
jgi:hypothetical protein